MQVKWLIIPKITSQSSSVFSQNWILHKSNLVLSVKVENHKGEFTPWTLFSKSYIALTLTGNKCFKFFGVFLCLAPSCCSTEHDIIGSVGCSQ